MARIHCDLKGDDFRKRLVWKTSEGFEVNPLYRMEDIDNLMYINTIPGEFPYIKGARTDNNSWLVRQNILVSDYSSANKTALDILMKGVDSLGFIIADPETINEGNFRVLLNDIHIDAIELNFLSEGKAKEILDILITIAGERVHEPVNIRGAIEADPLGRVLQNGKLCVHVEAGFDYLASLTAAAAALPSLRTIHLNASCFRNGGAGLVQELAFGLSMGNEYMSQLTDRGISVQNAASKIRFSFGVGSDYFLEIGKLRAARLLWSVIINGFDPSTSKTVKMDIHSETTRWNKTIYDPYVNMLRTQTEAMAAVLGGTDSLTVEPFDACFRKPDEFSERIARNQQLLLKEEAYFEKVADPAAGSYYIENITALIAENAWKLFLEIEEEGGFLASLKSGLIQKRISESAGNRKKDVSVRKTILLGTNKYPNNEESYSLTVDINRAFNNKSFESDLLVDPVRLFRGSEEYEKLRMAVDNADKRPVVFLMPIGNLVMRNARSQFSYDFFGCAGYQIIKSQGYDTVEEAIGSAAGSSADIMVICSSDEEYPVVVPAIYSMFNNRTILVVAGNPPCIDDLKTLGIKYFIHLRCDVTDMLKNFNNLLGINR
jgi:methylmalonyl-CoA mutase